MGGADDLEGDFCDNQQRKGDAQGANFQGPFRFAKKSQRDVAGQHCCCSIEQCVAKQDQAEQFVGLLQ